MTLSSGTIGDIIVDIVGRRTIYSTVMTEASALTENRTSWVEGLGLAAAAYFAAILVAFGPQYIPLLKRVLGSH